MSDFLLSEADEWTHAPSSEPHFNESVYVSAFDDVSGVGGWMRLGNRVNEGFAELSVCLYLPDGRLACQFQRPEITDNAAFSAGGLRFDVVTPFREVEIAFEGEVAVLPDPGLLREPGAAFLNGSREQASIVWRQIGASPLHGGVPARPDVEPYYGREVSLGHFNQHVTVSGEVRIGQESWAVQGRGWRDHSWGPRVWQNIFFHRLFTAHFPDGRGFMLLKIAERGAKSRRLGVLLVDGEYEEILDLDVVTDWDERQDPRGVRIVARTDRRSVEISGEILSLAPLRNRRKIGDGIVMSRIAEAATRFTWDGATAFGMSEYVERIENGRLCGFPS
jgi:hypothetical protein